MRVNRGLWKKCFAGTRSVELEKRGERKTRKWAKQFYVAVANNGMLVKSWKATE